MTPAVLADLIRSSADEVLTRRGLDPAVLPARVMLQRPRHPAHGDYATNLALRTAARAGVPPREFAGWLAEALAGVPGVRSAEVAGPGYLNLWLEPAALGEIVRQVLAAGARYGAGSDSTGFDGDGAGTAGADGGDHPDRPPTVLGEARYLHARLAGLARNATDLGVTSEGAQLGLLEHQREGELIRMLGEFPRAVAVGDRQRVTRYLAQLVSACHEFIGSVQVLPMGDQEPGPRHAARLALCQAARQVLANGLRLLEVSAPERM